MFRIRDLGEVRYASGPPLTLYFQWSWGAVRYLCDGRGGVKIWESKI